MLASCDGTGAPLRVAVGVTSRPESGGRRHAVRLGWARAALNKRVMACFLIGAVDWRLSAVTGAGKLRPSLPAVMHFLKEENRAHGDLLVLNRSAEEEGGRVGLKLLPWLLHAAERLPNAQWVAKADDATFIHVPALLGRLPSVPAATSLVGSMRWGCYSQPRRGDGVWIPEGPTIRSKSAARSARAADGLCYPPTPWTPGLMGDTGPYWYPARSFFAIPLSLARTISRCSIANAVHNGAPSASPSTSRAHVREVQFNSEGNAEKVSTLWGDSMCACYVCIWCVDMVRALCVHDLYKRDVCARDVWGGRCVGGCMMCARTHMLAIVHTS